MISIVVPAYNQVEYIADAIDSTLNQQWDNDNHDSIQAIEVIVVDDGSTDGTGELADKYKDKGVRVIHQVNKGLSSARNTGIMNAQGDWILFLDSDDVLLDNAIQRISKEIDKDEADMIAPSFKCFGVQTGDVILMKDPKVEDFKVDGKVVNRIGYCSAIRKSALLEIGGYSPRMVHGYEDMHLTINMLSRGKRLVTIQEILWLYRTKEQSMIHDAVKHHNELISQIVKDFPNL